MLLLKLQMRQGELYTARMLSLLTVRAYLTERAELLASLLKPLAPLR